MAKYVVNKLNNLQWQSFRNNNHLYENVIKIVKARCLKPWLYALISHKEMLKSIRRIVHSGHINYFTTRISNYSIVLGINPGRGRGKGRVWSWKEPECSSESFEKDSYIQVPRSCVVGAAWNVFTPKRYQS